MKIMIKKCCCCFAVSILGLFLFGCATVHTDTPQWALFPEKDYPPAQYAVAHGSGPNHRMAKKNAASALTEGFNIQMAEAEQLTSQLYREHGFPVGFRPVFKEGAPPQKPADIAPPGIRFGKYYTDDEDTVHTIAFFNRADAGKPFAKQMQTRASRVRELLADADSNPDPLSHFAFLRAALLYALQNEGAVAKATLIDPETAAAFRPGFSLTNVLARAA